jgi:RimJ/RimL family protein N-acetyltransferase
MVGFGKLELLLSDGKVVSVRAIESADRARLANFHDHLSDRTIYLRHFGHHPQLSESELDYFTQLDHKSREAIVAIFADEIVGVGRFDLISPTEAEVAFVIRDDFQRLGLGSGLFSILQELAQNLGVTHFSAEVLPQNRSMIRLFEVFGSAVSRETEFGITSVTVRID